MIRIIYSFPKLHNNAVAVAHRMVAPSVKNLLSTNGIFLKGNKNDFISLSQNYILQVRKSDVIVFTERKKTGILAISDPHTLL